MVRNLRVKIITATTFFGIVLFFMKYWDYFKNPDENEKKHVVIPKVVETDVVSNRWKEIQSTSDRIFAKKVNVNVNYIKSFDGLEINNELYVPFSFLKNYYEISGEFLESGSKHLKETSHFLWLHVNSTWLNVKKLSFPKYSSKGAYLTFHESDVSKRSRVKCISGVYEVPITTQWDPNGYFYPTQIAQYGLSHLSKFFKEDQKSPIKKILNLPNNHQGFYKFTEFPSKLFTIQLKFKRISSFTVKILGSDKKEYRLIYTTDDTVIKRSNGKSEITYGIGTVFSENVITRDLQVDLVKGLSFLEGKKAGNTVGTRIIKLISITFNDVENISSVKLMSHDHESKFMAAANWFLKFQDSNGGWKVNVRRVIFKGMEADTGWYSAMGQGQAISLLSRVFSYTDDEKYLKAAIDATKVFQKLSSEHGVKALLFQQLPWYEEYPTNPPSFVLNGFIYSLFGLYDLVEIAGAVKAKDAVQLFTEGFDTLEKALPLFDNGHGTFYDLRHISIPGHEPNRARWQYHRIHLEQLYALIDITNSKVLRDVLQRWIGYASGILSRHN